MISGVSSNSYSSYVQPQKQQNYFQKLDKDQNNSVDAEELSIMSEKISELSGEEISTSDLMSQIDQDGDSQLTGEELKAHIDSILGESGTPQGNPGMMMEGSMRKQMMMGPEGGGKPPGGKPPGGKPPGGMEQSGGITASTESSETSESVSLIDSLLESLEEEETTDLTDYLSELEEEEEEETVLSSIYQAMMQENMMKFSNLSMQNS